MKKRVSILTLTVACLLVFIAAYGLPMLTSKKPVKSDPVIVSDCPTGMEQIRLKKFQYIQPLILSDINNESAALQSLRAKVEQYIGSAKSTQQFEDVSVYFRRLNNGEWFCINPNRSYNPASMSKIIYLITYLKEAETNPAVMNKKLYFARHFSEGNQQNIKDFALSENANYTIHDLLVYMIRNSDNDATLLLSQNMNTVIYNQLFKDMEIPDPPVFGEYFITPVDYSKFFRILYNASYIRSDLSEFGLKLLTQSSYREGLVAGVDSTIEIAHKFGERILGNKAQLHEFGIVFVKGDPYLLGVMSQGTTLPELSAVIKEISRITYSEYMNMKNS